MEQAALTDRDLQKMTAPEPSCYLGRLLLSSRVSKVPQLEGQRVAQRIASRAGEEVAPRTFTYFADVFEAEINWDAVSASKGYDVEPGRVWFRLTCGGGDGCKIRALDPRSSDPMATENVKRYSWDAAFGRMSPLPVSVSCLAEPSPIASARTAHSR